MVRFSTGLTGRRIGWKRRMAWLLGILACGYLVWCGLLYVTQTRMMFPRDLVPEMNTAPPPEATVLTRGVAAGTVHAWFLPAPGVSADDPGPAAIFFHGNGERIEMAGDAPALYHPLGVSVLLVEYRGYGDAAGTPGQDAIRADAVFFRDRIADRPDVDAERIVYHGRSIGAAVAADLARERRPAGLVLQSPFTRTAAMAWRYGVPPFLVAHPFRTDAALRRLDGVDVLLFHGSADGIIPVSHSRRLARIAGDDAELVTYDCGHNDFPGTGNVEDYERRIAAFLDRAGVVRASGADGPP